MAPVSVRSFCVGLFSVAVASASQSVWLIGIQPFTGEDWHGGVSMRIAAEIMLEEISKNPAILPGYDLKVVWQNGHCFAALGESLFWQNVFNQTYTVFAPGRALAELDANRDGMITAEDTESMSEEWPSTRVTPSPVGLLGPGCSGTAVKIVKAAYFLRMPVVSNSATSAALSDRSIYPNFFRTLIPDSHFNPAWLSVVEFFGQSDVVLVIGDLGTWATMGMLLAQEAARRGISLQGQDLSEVDPNCRGLQLATDSSAAAAKVTRQLLKLKKRLVIMLLWEAQVRALLCENYKQGFLNAIYMTFGWLSPSWWVQATATCTSEQMFGMADGFITTDSLLWRRDSATRLSCSGEMTAQAFRRMFFERQGVPLGTFELTPEGYMPRDQGASTADAVCMYALILHELLVVRGIGLDALTSRSVDAYNEIQKLLSNMDFEGVQGRVRFTPGVSEPTGAVEIRQLQGPAGLVPLAVYRDGRLAFDEGAEFVLRFPDESNCGAKLRNGSIRSSTCPLPFRDCVQPRSDVRLDFLTNQCLNCPLGTQFVAHGPAGLICEPCPLGSYRDQHDVEECILCPIGSHGPQEGAETCQRCPRHAFSDRIGETSCIECPSGHIQGPDAGYCVLDYLLAACSLLVFFFTYFAILVIVVRHKRWVKIEDVSLVDGRLIVTTLNEHMVTYSWRRAKSTEVYVDGTGNPDMDGKFFRARKVHSLSLELLTTDEQHISKDWSTSKGFLQQRLPYTFTDTGNRYVSIPSIICIFLFAIGIPPLIYAGDVGKYTITAMMSLGVFMAGAYGSVRRLRMTRELTPLENAHKTFRKRLRSSVACPRKTERGMERAVTVDKLKDLYNYYHGNYIKNRTMHFVYSNLVLPLTESDMLSYAEFVGPSEVEWFVSHCWASQFVEFVTSIAKHDENVVNSAFPTTTYWICTFSINQWDVKTELGTEIQDSSFYLALYSSTCMGTAMVIDHEALPLKRVWCLFEIMTTCKLSQTRDNFEGIVLCNSSGVLNRGSADMDTAIKIACAVLEIDLQKAEATCQADKDAILELVGSMEGGFNAMNEFVRTALQQSLLEIHDVFEKRFNALLETVQAQAHTLNRLTTSSTDDQEKLRQQQAEVLHKLASSFTAVALELQSSRSQRSIRGNSEVQADSIEL